MSKIPQYLGWLSIIVAGAACQSGTSSRDPAPTPETSDEVLPLAVGPEREIEVAQHVALAFHAKNGALVGGYQAHEAAIHEGKISLTPYTPVNGERVAHAPLELETTGITVDEALFGGMVSGTRVEDGQAIIDRQGIEEVVRNLVDGIHQEWRFAERPALIGDLVVDLAVSGERYTGTTSQGLHFAGTDGVGFRYSNAVWVGADGKEWPIDATYVEGHIRITVPGDVVAETQFPAVLDPTVTAEVAADAPVAGFSGANSQNAAIAFDGTNYLVVWDDNRNSQEADIWGTRVNQAGTILDNLGIQIATAPGKQQNPAVAFNGTAFVVAWEDFKVSGGTEADIDAALVSTAGAVTPLAAVAATGTSETQPVLAGGGGNALLAWNANGDVRGAVFSGSFGAPFNIAATTASETEPTVAKNPGGNYLVAWTDGPATSADLHGQFVTAGGALSGAAFAISAGAGVQSAGNATFDGTNFAVVWANNSNGINVYGTRVNPATGAALDTHTEGTVTGVGGIVITAAISNQEVPVIGCLSTGCLVLWQDRRNFATTGFDVYGQLLTPAFALSGGEMVISGANANQFGPQLAAGTGGFYGVWTDTRDLSSNAVFGATLGSSGAPGTAGSLAKGNNRETAPHLGRVANGFGVFWSDSRVFGNDIMYVRFNSSGTKLDTTARIASNATGAQLTPSASGDLGANTLVVWSDGRSGQPGNRDIYGSLVSLTNGAALQPAGIPIATATADQIVPDVASNGTVALVVWQDRRNGNFDIYGALVDANGAVTASDIVICNAAGDQGRPSVAWDATSSQFIVVWSDARLSGVSHIFGARVSSAGVNLDAGTSGVQISSGAVGQFGGAIASTSGASLVVWEDRQSGSADIRGSRVTGGGSLTALDNSIAISTAAGSQNTPRVAAVGTSFTVVWVDGRATQTDIYAQQVSTSGVPSGAEFVVSNTPDNELNADILGTTGTGLARITYETQRLNTSRVSTRTITTEATPGATCTSNAQCQTGFCVDGRCCDSACGGNDNTDCQACNSIKTSHPDGICSPVVPTTICRGYASSFCDLREYCDGVNPQCPPDVGRNQGLTCSGSSNYPATTGTGICPSNAAPGPHGCPTP